MGFHDIVYLTNIRTANILFLQNDIDGAYNVLQAYAIYLGVEVQNIKMKDSPFSKREEFFKLYKLVHSKLKDIMLSINQSVIKSTTNSNSDNILELV